MEERRKKREKSKSEAKEGDGDKKRSRSRDRKRSKERKRSRSKSRDRRRSRSRDRRRRSRSRDRKRRSRSRSRDHRRSRDRRYWSHEFLCSSEFLRFKKSYHRPQNNIILILVFVKTVNSWRIKSPCYFKLVLPHCYLSSFKLLFILAHNFCIQSKPLLYPIQTKYSFEFQLLMIYLFFIQYKPNIQLNSNFDDL